MGDEVKKGLLGIVVDETTISQVMPDINSLTYRGYAVQDLCEKCSFEEVAYLVLNGELPNKSQLKKYIEKPTFDYKVSMGINVFNKPSIQNFVKENEYLDIPDLMMKLKKNSHKVLCHEQDCKWLDIGRVDDYEVAQKVFSRDKSIFLPDK